MFSHFRHKNAKIGHTSPSHTYENVLHMICFWSILKWFLLNICLLSIFSSFFFEKMYFFMFLFPFRRALNAEILIERYLNYFLAKHRLLLRNKKTYFLNIVRWWNAIGCDQIYCKHQCCAFACSVFKGTLTIKKERWYLNNFYLKSLRLLHNELETKALKKRNAYRLKKRKTKEAKFFKSNKFKLLQKHINC